MQGIGEAFQRRTVAGERPIKCIFISSTFLILLSFLSWLLFAPLLIHINTWKPDFSIRWVGLGSAALVLVNDELGIRLRILFFKKTLYPLRPQLQQKVSPEAPKPSKNKVKKKKWPKMTWRRVQKLLRVIKVRQCKAELDTGDFVTNAYLYPLATVLNKPTHQLAVNFEGRTNLLLQLEIRLIRIVQAMIF